MDWDEYKALCDRPDHWTRWMLEQNINLFDQLDRADLSDHLKSAITGQPLETPPDHKGPPATQVIRIELSVALRAQMLAAVEDAKARGITTPQTERRGLGGFVEAWREYAQFEARQ